MKEKNGLYDNCKDSKYWDVVEQAIYDLEENKDFIPQTHHDIIVGYIVKQLEKNDRKNKQETPISS